MKDSNPTKVLIDEISTYKTNFYTRPKQLSLVENNFVRLNICNLLLGVLKADVDLNVDENIEFNEEALTKIAEYKTDNKAFNEYVIPSIKNIIEFGCKKFLNEVDGPLEYDLHTVIEALLLHIGETTTPKVTYRNFLDEMMIQINNRYIKEFEVNYDQCIVIKGSDCDPQALYDLLKSIFDSHKLSSTYYSYENPFTATFVFEDSWLTLSDINKKLFEFADENDLYVGSDHQWTQFRKPSIFSEDKFEIDQDLKKKYTKEYNGLDFYSNEFVCFEPFILREGQLVEDTVEPFKDYWVETERNYIIKNNKITETFLKSIITEYEDKNELIEIH